MAYSTANPPKKVSGGIGAGPQHWIYDSADTVTTVRGADYFSNATDIGLKVGDVVEVVQTGTAVTTTVVSAVSAGGAATVV
jgi:hypothetical protein